MPDKSLRYVEGKKGVRSFGEVLRQRIDASKAVETINKAIKGKEISRIQLDACRIALNKVLPDLQAVAIGVLDGDAPLTKADIDAMLLEAQVKPESVWPEAIDSSATRVDTE